MPRFYRLERREPCGQVKENPLRDKVSLLFSSLVSLFGKHNLHLIIPREQNFRNKLL